MFINFGDLPSQHNISLDYMYEFENVERFYRLNFRNKESYAERFRMISEHEHPHRLKVTSAIQSYYSDKSPSQVTLRNISALTEKNSIAVVTGQQLGLFGGPLYTVFKTITAIKLCTTLKEQHPDFNFIPVFWLEGDDHDFDEISFTNLFNQSGELVKVEYTDGIDSETNRGSMAKVQFNQNISETLENLRACLRETEFKEEVLKIFSGYNAEGAGFLSAFSTFLFNIFDEHGLVLFNPHAAELKQALIPVFEKEILHYAEHSADTLEVSAELEEFYHAQVKVQPINLFFSEDKGRYLIEPREGEYSLKGKRKKFTKEELMERLHAEPERFSPNVLLRPICQDFLLPTAFYVGGPSEVAYFAQVIPLYKHFELVQPYVYPRASATILEKPAQKILAKYSLNFGDLWDETTATEKIVKQLSEFKLEQVFDEANRSTEEIFQNLRMLLIKLDTTLGDAAGKSEARAKQNLEQLLNRSKKAEERLHSDALRQVHRARNLVFPNNNFQEREINLIYFANKFGMDFLKRLFDELSISRFEHQLIEL